MPLDTAYVWWNGIKYAVTANVDETEEIVYQVLVHFAPPIVVENPHVDSFTPAEANTPLRMNALDAIETLYGINPVLDASDSHKPSP